MNEMQQVSNVKVVECYYYSEERRCDTPAEKTINQMIPSDVFSQVVVRREKAALDDDIDHFPADQYFATSCFLSANLLYKFNKL